MACRSSASHPGRRRAQTSAPLRIGRRGMMSAGRKTAHVRGESLMRQSLVGFLTLMLLWTSPVAAQPTRDAVVIGMEAEPPGLDPGQALGLHTLRVTYQIFETLVTTPD